MISEQDCHPALVLTSRMDYNSVCSQCGRKMTIEGRSYDVDAEMEFEYISVHVRNPRTHLLHGRPVYTDYEIVVLTNSMIFAKRNTFIRRRFSEFVWLWKQLKKYTSCSMKLPFLPTKTRFFCRFSKDFLEERRNGLQEALASLTRITAILADTAFHLFLQSTLTINEMENVLNGRDKREVCDIIAQATDGIYAEPHSSREKGRKSTCHSTGDSGYSGSVKPDDHTDKRGLFADVSSWVTSQHNFASSSLVGNGWSSGYACQTTNQLESASPTCPDCLAKRSLPVHRRRSLSEQVASVLPGGQLFVASSGEGNDREPRDRPDHSSSGDSKPYDGDDETDFNLLDYEIIKEEPLLRVRNWLRSQDKISECNSSEEEDATDVRLNEYDIISIPCHKTSPHHQSVGCHSNKGKEVKQEEAKENDDDDSAFSVVHSSIDNLDWKDRDEMTTSCDSLNSAAVFLTYDVVEMIELRFSNVV